MEEQKVIDLLQLSKSQYNEAVRWQWQSDEDPWKESDPTNWTWQNYSDYYCLIIEQAFSLDKETVDLQDYQLDLKKMLQVNKNNRSRVRRVRRQVQSRFMMDMPEPKILIQEQKTMNEAFGTIQHFLDYIMKRTPEADGLYQRLKTLTLDSKSHEFGDIMKQVVACIEKGAEEREKVIKSRPGSHFIHEAKKIINEIKNSSLVLRDFLKTVLKVYTMETFICYWLNELLRSENWKEINVLTPYLVCLVYTFKLSEYTVQYQKPQKSFKNFLGLVSNQTLCLYRGTRLTKEHLDLYITAKGKYFSWNGVTSTSRNKHVALNFVQLSLTKSNPQKIGVIFLIETNFASSKDCEGMIDVSQNSQYPDEQEIILAPGTVFELLKTRKIENDLYEISRKVTKKFNKKEEATLLGTLHDDAVQYDTAIIEGFPSPESFKVLKFLRGNTLIKKLEIRNSEIDEETMKEIENMRMTTNVKKQDIKLYSNFIMVSSVALLIDYFSLDNLNKICEVNEIQFLDDGTTKNNQHQTSTTILLRGNVLEKLRCHNQWKSLWSSLKNESQTLTLDLSLEDLWASNDELSDVIDFIQGLKFLQNLKLIFNKYQTKQIKAFWGVIGPSSTLKKLDLELDRSESGLNFAEVQNTLLKLTSLQHLSLHFKEFRTISDEDLNHLKNGFMSLKALQYLSLDFSDCKTISDGGLNLLKNSLISLKHLQHLSLGFSNCKNISDEGLNHLKSASISLTSLKYLSLKLSGCRKISNEGLYHLQSSLTSLISLQHLSFDFSNCKIISNEGLIYLKNGIKPLKCLQHLSLNFAHCETISDEGLNYLRDGIKSLRFLQYLSLDFSCCYQISNAGLGYLKEGLKPLTSLKDLTLEFESCKKISIEGLEYLKSGLIFLGSLRNLKMYLIDCPRISRKEKDRLESDFRCLEFAPYILIL